VICYFAILKAGGTVVNYDPLRAEEQFLRQVEDSETEIFVTLDVTALYLPQEHHVSRPALAGNRQAPTGYGPSAFRRSD
jgi:hypothetical protein